jgi:pimeloyl-ACP methyl ester carboxylesterase
MRWLLPLLFTLCFIVSPLSAQDKKKEKAKVDPPTEDVIKEIQAKTKILAAKIAELRKEPRNHALLPDVEIYLRGAESIVRFNEFYTKDSVKWTFDSIERGMQRAEQLAKGQTPWTQLATRNVVRGYRSKIDGTAQPYAVTYPLPYHYKDEKAKPYRVDVVLHGRNATLTEVAFLNSHNGSRKPAADQDWIQIDIFGRGNNAYRWAGETDVLEAVEAFFAGEPKTAGHRPDPRRVVLRGFSMGGAGTWHLGLHHPDKWCVMGPGAGFTTTHGYAGGLPNPLPDYQEKCLRIYDAIDYVENARMIPIVAYSGGDDPQKKAADNIEGKLKDLKIDAMTHLVAPGLGHTFPSEWFKQANALWSKHAEKGHDDSPKKVQFVTYTTKFNKCDWVEILGLEEHYKKATVNAEINGNDLRITTTNVRALHLTLTKTMPAVPRVFINNKEEPAVVVLPKDGSRHLYYRSQGGTWTALTQGEWLKEQSAKLQKLHGLQGPIDDAFASGFVCVIGSGDTWHPATKKYVDAKVEAFKKDWARHWRGELPTTGDYAVNPNDIKDRHLILFGDPSSNLTLAQILPKLPLKWTKDEIEFAGQKYKSADHVPVMIFPNPLNPKKYVVLNTGHTIPSEDYAKTNAMLFPRLGDYAVLRLTPNAKNAAAFEIATAGLFNESWQVK